MNNKTKKLVVLGAGESGLQAALLGKLLQWDVFVSDRSALSPETKQILSDAQIPYEEGGHHLENLLDADIAIKSPGIPPWVEMIQALRREGIEILSEIDFAASQMPGANFVAITGSNGKTTTTSLTAHLLREAGFDAVETGNIGVALARYAQEWVKGKKHDVYVVELSSFQLEDMPHFAPQVAILLNITPDHLDRYNHSLQEYADVKGKVFNGLSAGSLAVYFAEDEQTQKLLQRHPLPEALSAIPFFLHEEKAEAAKLPYYACLRDDALFFALPIGRFSLSLDDLPLKGLHNYQNIMAAVIASCNFGLDTLFLKEGLRKFQSVPHRMEPCGNIGSVSFINDSKATNIDATYYALGAMPEQDVILILGGTDKGNDYNSILESIKRSCKGFIFLTTDYEKLEKQLAPLGLPMQRTQSMPEAVQKSLAMAQELGASIVLLSPACASFDLFKNYVDRGDQFRQLVQQDPNYEPPKITR